MKPVSKVQMRKGKIVKRRLKKNKRKAFNAYNHHLHSLHSYPHLKNNLSPSKIQAKIFLKRNSLMNLSDKLISSKRFITSLRLKSNTKKLCLNKSKLNILHKEKLSKYPKIFCAKIQIPKNQNLLQ